MEDDSLESRLQELLASGCKFSYVSGAVKSSVCSHLNLCLPSLVLSLVDNQRQLASDRRHGLASAAVQE